MRKEFDTGARQTRFDSLSHSLEVLARKQDPMAAINLLKPYIDDIEGNKLFTEQQKIKLLMTYTKLLSGCNRFAEALPHSARTCSMRPDDIRSWTRHAFILKHMGEFQTAEQIYKMAIETAPDDIMLWAGLGDLYEMQSNMLAAIECYEQIKAIKPDDFIASDRLLALRHG